MWTHVRDAAYAIVDVETTGFDRVRDRVVEVACVRVRGGREVETFSTLVDPGRPIPERATAVHGITDADVAGKPSLAALSPTLQRLCEGAIVVAHNAAFDRGFLPMLADRPGLCTMRLARRAFPEFHSHALQVLRRALDLNVPDDVGAAHRALGDARVTAALLRVLLRRYVQLGYPPDTAALVAAARARLPFPRFPFGKYRGVPIANVPAGYLEWMLRCADPPFDGDVRATASAELARRSAASAHKVGATLRQAS